VVGRDHGKGFLGRSSRVPVPGPNVVSSEGPQPIEPKYQQNARVAFPATAPISCDAGFPHAEPPPTASAHFGKNSSSKAFAWGRCSTMLVTDLFFHANPTMKAIALTSGTPILLRSPCSDEEQRSRESCKAQRRLVVPVRRRQWNETLPLSR
jgi:hypothetical protein